jgi:eukaryotic-like serine/threonine-protein kinase
MCRMDLSLTTLPESRFQKPSGQMVSYHCGCGLTFQVSIDVGGLCVQCGHRIEPDAIRAATNETVSIVDMSPEAEPGVNHFAIDEDEQIANRKYGHFRIDRRLGSGGMGAVYRALDTSLQRYVAVKILRNPNQCADDRAATMQREAVAQAKLNHPNVVTIYYVGRQDEEPFLAMELLPGPTLAEKLKTDRSIPYADAIRYAIQVASALEHASQFGIVHADIKPANLIIAADGRIKLSDFGLSRIHSAGDRKQSISGTPAYVAPELILGGGLSVQSDMYALGITLFELVFGEAPYELTGATVRDRMQCHLTSIVRYPVSWPMSVPRGFQGVINRLLAKDPKARFGTYADLISDLKRIQPVNTTTAGFALRMMAYSIDQFFLLLCISPFAFTIFLLNSSAVGVRGYQWMAPIIAFLSLLVPTAYLAITYRGWRSLGRYLFQLRIVDENGLPARREQLVAREFLRNAFAWFFPLLLYINPDVAIDNDTGFGTLGTRNVLIRGLEFALVLFLAIDWGTALLLKARRSLHDYLCHSRVVLAVDRASTSN